MHGISGVAGAYGTVLSVRGRGKAIAERFLSFQYLEQALATGKMPEEAGARIPSIHDVFGGGCTDDQAAAAAAVKDGSPVASAGIAASEAVSEHFSVAMMGASLGNFRCLAQAFDFGSVRSIGDMGGSNGCLSACLCQVELWPVIVSRVATLDLLSLYSCGLFLLALPTSQPPNLFFRTCARISPRTPHLSPHLMSGTPPPDRHKL